MSVQGTHKCLLFTSLVFFTMISQVLKMAKGQLGASPMHQFPSRVTAENEINSIANLRRRKMKKVGRVEATRST